MIQISDQLGSEWSLFAQIHTVMAEQVYMASRWRCLPFHRLKCVRFEIEAPHPHDPGQLIQMWNKLCWLLDLLPNLERLPDVEVCAVETSDRKWCKNGRLLITSKDKVPSNLTHWQWLSNLEILLTPFLRLRMAKTIVVIHPFEGCKELLDTLISNILRKATSTIPFGLDHNCDDEDSDDESANIDDEVTLSMEDTWTVWFDYILDDLPGPSARFARLERFSTWNMHYEKNMWCLINGWETSMGGCLLSDSERHSMVEALTERVLAKLAFNPMSLRQLEEDEQPSLWYTADDWSRPENDVLDSGKTDVGQQNGGNTSKESPGQIRWITKNISTGMGTSEFFQILEEAQVSHGPRKGGICKGQAASYEMKACELSENRLPQIIKKSQN